MVQGQKIDAPLNMKGVSQSILLSTYLNELEHSKKNFHQVFCSSLQRTKQTLQPFLDSSSGRITLQEEPLLNEISWGIHEGKIPSKRMKKDFNEMLNDWAKGDIDTKVEGGESARDCLVRVDSFIEKFLEHAEGRILICCHGWTVKFFLHRLINSSLADLKHFRVPNTGLFALNRQSDTWTLHEQAPDLHLKTKLS